MKDEDSVGGEDDDGGSPTDDSGGDDDDSDASDDGEGEKEVELFSYKSISVTSETISYLIPIVDSFSEIYHEGTKERDEKLAPEEESSSHRGRQ